MSEDVELEWRRHLLSALDNVAKKVDENSSEHVAIRAEIASVRMDVAALKSSDPEKKFSEYIQSSRAWRMTIVGQVVAILVLVGTFIWNFSAINSTVNTLKENQIKNLKDVEELKFTSPEYREFRLKIKAQEELSTVKVPHNG